MAEIRPMHFSMAGKRRLPKGMEELQVTNEQREFIDEFSMRIFADCVNNGQTFQAAIASVYLSGLENGISIAGES